MNAQYIQATPPKELVPYLLPFLPAVGLEGADPDRLAAALDLYRPRARTLKEMAELLPPYFLAKLHYDPEACAKFLADPALPGHLAALRDRWAALPEFSVEALDGSLRAEAEAKGIKAAVLIHPVRMALTAATGGPSLFHLVEVMGREATLRHLDQFLEFLNAHPRS
jgi:glutamyl/glutaminyl-tRNA synthetase